MSTLELFTVLAVSIKNREIVHVFLFDSLDNLVDFAASSVENPQGPDSWRGLELEVPQVGHDDGVEDGLAMIILMIQRELQTSRWGSSCSFEAMTLNQNVSQLELPAYDTKAV